MTIAEAEAVLKLLPDAIKTLIQQAQKPEPETPKEPEYINGEPIFPYCSVRLWKCLCCYYEERSFDRLFKQKLSIRHVRNTLDFRVFIRQRNVGKKSIYELRDIFNDKGLPVDLHQALKH